MSYNSLVVRLINNAIGLYLYKVSEKFVNEFVNNKDSNISSRYGGKIKYNDNGKISLNKENRNMAYYLKCQEAGRKAGITMPEQEEITFTNFIR